MNQQRQIICSGYTAVLKASEIFQDYFRESLARSSSRKFFDLPALLGVKFLPTSGSIMTSQPDPDADPSEVAKKVLHIFYLELVRDHYGPKGKSGCDFYNLANQFFEQTDVLNHLSPAYLALHMICQMRFTEGFFAKNKKYREPRESIENALGQSDLNGNIGLLCVNPDNGFTFPPDVRFVFAVQSQAEKIHKSCQPFVEAFLSHPKVQPIAAQVRSERYEGENASGGAPVMSNSNNADGLDSE